MGRIKCLSPIYSCHPCEKTPAKRKSFCCSPSENEHVKMCGRASFEITIMSHERVEKVASMFLLSRHHLALYVWKHLCPQRKIRQTSRPKHVASPQSIKCAALLYVVGNAALFWLDGRWGVKTFDCCKVLSSVCPANTRAGVLDAAMARGMLRMEMETEEWKVQTMFSANPPDFHPRSNPPRANVQSANFHKQQRISTHIARLGQKGDEEKSLFSHSRRPACLDLECAFGIQNLRLERPWFSFTSLRWLCSRARYVRANNRNVNAIIVPVFIARQQSRVDIFPLFSPWKICVNNQNNHV